MIRVVICDDHPVLCDGLTSVLSQNPGILVLDPVSSGSAALELVARDRPDVLLLDVSLPDGSGIDLIPRLQRYSPTTRIIIVTAHLSRGLIESAFAAGANGYLSKESAGLHLIEAVQAVMRGERFCGPKAIQHLDPPDNSVDDTNDSNGDQAIARYSSLSLREQQVLRLLVTGAPSSDIASSLSISRKTVDVHRSNIYRKLGVDNPLQVWRLAVRLGITEDRETRRS